ncbi:MAG: hypothetical protein J6O56_01665 [Bacilli bacterium]|nr:hypothetical protein [Bacilli bacterium]
MLEKYIKEQEIVTNLLTRSIKEDKLVQAYLFCCDDVEYAYMYAKEFTKDIIASSKMNDEILRNIYKRIDNDEYTELKVVETSGNIIKKEQLLYLQKDVQNKPVEGNKIIYIIKNCEKLNSSSANSILKFLEEPADDIIAILITNNINLVMPTIKSRCQILNFKNVRKDFEEIDKLKKYILPENIDIEDEDIDNLINSSFEFIKTIEKTKKSTIIYEKELLWDKFKTSNDILILLNIMLYSYMDALYIKLGKNINYMFSYEQIPEELSNINEKEDLINKINIIEVIKNDLKMNVNSKLLFDKLIIELSEV